MLMVRRTVLALDSTIDSDVGATIDGFATAKTNAQRVVQASKRKKRDARSVLEMAANPVHDRHPRFHIDMAVVDVEGVRDSFVCYNTFMKPWGPGSDRDPRLANMHLCMRRGGQCAVCAIFFNMATSQIARGNFAVDIVRAAHRVHRVECVERTHHAYREPSARFALAWVSLSEAERRDFRSRIFDVNCDVTDWAMNRACPIVKLRTTVRCVRLRTVDVHIMRSCFCRGHSSQASPLYATKRLHNLVWETAGSGGTIWPAK